MFKEFYDLTWFVVKHDNCVVQTRRGSRPGDALADICFSYALTRILKGPLAKLTQLFPDIQLQWNGQNDPLPNDNGHVSLPLAPIWADDIAVAFDDSRPAGLVQKAKTITSVILDALTSAGLKPNLKSGKTELLLDLRGQGSQESRRQIGFPTCPKYRSTQICHVCQIKTEVKMEACASTGLIRVQPTSSPYSARLNIKCSF